MESTPEAYASFRTFPVMAGWGQETAHATRTVSQWSSRSAQPTAATSRALSHWCSPPVPGPTPACAYSVIDPKIGGWSQAVGKFS